MLLILNKIWLLVYILMLVVLRFHCQYDVREMDCLSRSLIHSFIYPSIVSFAFFHFSYKSCYLVQYYVDSIAFAVIDFIWHLFLFYRLVMMDILHYDKWWVCILPSLLFLCMMINRICLSQVMSSYRCLSSLCCMLVSAITLSFVSLLLDTFWIRSLSFLSIIELINGEFVCFEVGSLGFNSYIVIHCVISCIARLNGNLHLLWSNC